MWRVVLVLSVFAGLSFAQVRNFEVEISTSDSIINLPHRFIVPKSEVLKLDTLTLIRGLHYLVNYKDGEIFLFQNFASRVESTKVKLKVFYKTIPVEREFLNYKTAVLSDTSFQGGKILKVEGRDVGTVSSGGNIQKNGSIVRGFTFGSNRDLTLQSGFNLQLSGSLTKDVEVVASLTDENIPIQPEGNTQTLQEIDKIFIQLRSKKLFATFGDYDIGYQLSDEQSLYFSEAPEFANIRRRLQGGKFQANYEVGPLKTRNTIAIASSRGKFATNYFNGIDGLQGPYKLTGQNGERDIIIIAGTEKVYIDGELMTRGESNDYIIDYSAGEITFTPNRLITSASRITVDFQYTDRKYARNFFAFASDNLLFDDKLNFSLSYFYDADNKNAPIDLILSSSDFEILRSAGDNFLKAVKSGVTFVGFDSAKGIGKGQYVKKDTIIDSLRYEILVYSPGDREAFYSVSFSYVGAGKGDYIRKGMGRYEFVGKGKGEYLPVVFLPMPQSSQIWDMKASYKTKNLVFFFETAFSNFDKNQFSSLNDEDNKGGALKYGFGYSSGEISKRGLRRIEFNIFQRRKDRNFYGIDRFNVIEFDRKWNIIDENLQLGETMLESAIRLDWFNKSSLNMGYGSLNVGGRFKANRGMINLRFNEDNLPKLENVTEVLISRSDTISSKWVRNRGKIDYEIAFLTPFLSYEMEDRKVFIGDLLSFGSFRFSRMIPGVEFGRRGFKVGFSYEIRVDDSVKAARYVRSSVTRNQNYMLDLQAKNFNINGELTFNKKIYSDSASRLNNVLARFQGRAEVLKRSLRTGFVYRAMTRMIAPLEPVFIKVQRGSGNYRYLGDLNGNGIQDASEFEQTKFDGDYIMFNLPSGQLIPSANVDLSFNLRFYPERLFISKSKLLKLLSAFSSDTYLQISENSLESWEKIYLLRLKYFQRDGKTMGGAMTFRQDLYLFENGQKISLRYRYLKSSSMYSYTIATKKIASLENSLRIRWYPEYDLGFQVEGLLKNKRSTGGFKENDLFDIHGQGLNVDIFYKPFSYVELGFKIGVGRNRDELNKRTADLNRGGVKLSWLLIGRGRADIEVERIETVVHGGSNVLSYELVEGNYVGRSVFIRASFSYGVGDYIQVSGNYNARFTSEGVVHIAGAEVRVYF